MPPARPSVLIQDVPRNIKLNLVHLSSDMLSFISIIITLVFLPSSPLARAYICTRPHGVLPSPKDCHELIDSIEALSRIPPFNTPKLWSRHVEDTAETLKLPKDYWLQGRGPSTCAFHVDVVPWGDLNGNDTFSFRGMATAGEIIVEQCLVKRRKLGLAYPGVKELVQVRVIRTDAPWLKDKVGKVRNVFRLWNGTNLYEATDEPSKSRDVAVQR